MSPRGRNEFPNVLKATSQWLNRSNTEMQKD
jgi:hypothetical protein